jgi:hypothetical protein
MDNIIDTQAAGDAPTVSDIIASGSPAESQPGNTARTDAMVKSILPSEGDNYMEEEKRISSNVMSICLTPDGVIIKDEDKHGDDGETNRLSGVYCEGVQYYDLSGIKYINNTGMAILIDLLKSLLEMGVEVQFVNVHESIKKKIKEMGLDKIINCGER